MANAAVLTLKITLLWSYFEIIFLTSVRAPVRAYWHV
jgi:hypothetical protein